MRWRAAVISCSSKRVVALAMVTCFSRPLRFSREVTSRMPLMSREKVVIRVLPAGTSLRPSMRKEPISILLRASGSSP